MHGKGVMIRPWEPSVKVRATGCVAGWVAVGLLGRSVFEPQVQQTPTLNPGAEAGEVL